MFNWELENNNFGGLRIPGVFASPTQGGFQSYATPEGGLTAIAHQLDRYFTGQTTGKPLNTLRQIVNTWAPPSDHNPTSALIQRASGVLGVRPDDALDFNNADTRAKLIEATVRNEQGGKLPVDPSLITKVATSYTPGAAAAPASGRTNMQLPPFGNTRALAQLTPSVEQTGGVPMDDPSTVAPPAVPTAAPAAAAPPGLAGFGQAPIAGAGGGTDMMSMLPKLLAQAKAMGLVHNQSQTLANMAAGFLGGRGPAASLAGGFAGLAKSQASDQEGGLGLLKMALTGGLGMQEQQLKTFTALTNVGVPIAQAAAASGITLPNAQGGASAGGDTHGGEFLKTLEPNQAAQVKALAEGRMQFPSGFALKTPYWQNVLRQVGQYDPEFDAVNYNSRAKTRADFTSGKSAQNMTALNTAIGHAGTVLDAGTALGNTNYPLINEGVNAYRSATGDPRVPAFGVAKQALVDEMTRVFRGTGGSNADIEGWEKNINAAQSPEQLKGVIKQAMNLLASRASGIAEQYKKGMGTSAQPLSLLSPHSLEALKKLPGGDALIQEMGGDPSAYQTPAAAPAATPAAMSSTPSGVRYRQIN